MKAEGQIFVICTVFLIGVTPAYWLITANTGDTGGDRTGTSALTMTTLLVLMVAIYLRFTGGRMEPRPEDKLDAEIADGAGELGFFPPYSWWPLWCAATLGVMVLGVAFLQWWMFIIGGVLGAIALSGLVFEYYRGEHAH